MTYFTSNGLIVSLKGDKVNVNVTDAHQLTVTKEDGTILFQRNVQTDKNHMYNTIATNNSDSETSRNVSSTNINPQNHCEEGMNEKNCNKHAIDHNSDVQQHDVERVVSNMESNTRFKSYAEEEATLNGTQYTRPRKPFNWRKAYGGPLKPSKSNKREDPYHSDESYEYVAKYANDDSENIIDMVETRSNMPRQQGKSEMKAKKARWASNHKP